MIKCNQIFIKYVDNNNNVSNLMIDGHVACEDEIRIQANWCDDRKERYQCVTWYGWILQQNLFKYGVMCTGLIWLRIRTSDGLLWARKWVAWNSSSAGRKLVSQEWLMFYGILVMMMKIILLLLLLVVVVVVVLHNNCGTIHVLDINYIQYKLIYIFFPFLTYSTQHWLMCYPNYINSLILFACIV
jgi:hypothetical protein